MKKCIYPLVIYADKEEQMYLSLFPDLDLSASGDTIEEVYLDALENLQTYLQLAKKFDSDIPSASTFEEMATMNPKRVVLLAMVEVDLDNLVLTDSEQQYKNFLQKLIVEG